MAIIVTPRIPPPKPAGRRCADAYNRDVPSIEEPEYLKPYLRAAERHGGGFRALLWASTLTQTKRFDALARLCDFTGKSVLDVGCGRADLLDFLLKRGREPDHYVGLEAVGALADEAEAKHHERCIIVRSDFIAQPARMFVGADIIAISGALNTLETPAFYKTLRAAYDATASELVFNFLCSPMLAGTWYLRWHRPATVMQFIGELPGEVKRLDDYIDGDCTIRIRKPQ